jgi:hypothetical protein
LPWSVSWNGTNDTQNPRGDWGERGGPVMTRA